MMFKNVNCWQLIYLNRDNQHALDGACCVSGKCGNMEVYNEFTT